MDNNHPNFYVNDEGLFVLKESFLIKRGSCCGSKCLHCPYDPCQKGTTDLKPQSKTDNNS
jgi:hypothetical protein